ncbi:class I SAM-dependent methyltransferase [Salirhabdus salicampi]|uniref:class I SAM-dependent methyltransferase n=1 Tax=Salirhabdus salicampi TaxID=476102 RepID=UPI0020C4F1E7|nr:class I SAM-dependent methyltransferase [Salirhabdus salicampi]MCP8618128.1 class I SAM-dependent methyltransferase [Salirhabdus salicampi]
MKKESFWHKSAQQQWDEKAEFWHQSSENMWEKGSRKDIIPFFRKFVGIGSKVADIGCGDGYGSYKLSQLQYKVTGIDISAEMIKRANQRKSGIPLTFEVGDIIDLPLASNSFDAVMAINSLEWTALPVKAVKEIRRIVKPGGHLCVGILGPTATPRGNSFQRLYGEDVICNTMMPWEFRKLAENIGFNVIDGLGVYKEGVTSSHTKHLPEELKQALTFMWVFILKKV